jgi:GTP-binding nuclear protein Ran
MTEITEYKIVFIGSAGVGKTTIANQIITGEFTKKYISTLGVEIFPIIFHTTNGIIRFIVWDCAGQDRFGGLRDGYYIKSDACIGVMDNSKISRKILKQHIINFKRICPNVPVVKILNKCELNTDNSLKNIIYVSAKYNLNLEKPFLQIARQLTGIPDLQFIDGPAIAPPLTSVLQSCGVLI